MSIPLHSAKAQIITLTTVAFAQPLSVDFLSDVAREQWRESTTIDDFELSCMDRSKQVVAFEATAARPEAQTRSTSSPHRLRGRRGHSTGLEQSVGWTVGGVEGGAGGLRVAVFIAMPAPRPSAASRQETSSREERERAAFACVDVELCVGVVRT